MSSGKTIGLIKAVGGPGGGGGTSDAVQYIPQELTEAQQMQARKNLGVYGTEGDNVHISWDENTDGLVSVSLGGDEFWCVSSETPSNDELLRGYFIVEGNRIYTSTISGECLVLDDIFSSPYCVVVRSKTVTIEGEGSFEFPEIGTYFIYSKTDICTDFVAGKKIVTIPTEYIPNMPFCVNITPSPDYEGEFVADKSYSEVKEAEAQKRPITGTFTSPNGPVYTLVGCDGAADSCYFVAFDVATPAPVLFKLELVDSESNKVKAYIFELTATDITG